jgi:hypothetical protein
MGRTACTEPQYLYKGDLYLYLTVELYLYSPYGPYGLYRASVPVQGVTFTFTFTTLRMHTAVYGLRNECEQMLSSLHARHTHTHVTGCVQSATPVRTRGVSTSSLSRRDRPSG